MHAHSTFSAPRASRESMQQFLKIFCPTSNWLGNVFQCSPVARLASLELLFIIDALILLMNNIFVNGLYAFTLLFVVVLIAYRSHLIARTEESFIHLILQEIFSFVFFFFRWWLDSSLFVTTIAIVAQWKKSTDTLGKHCTLLSSVHCGSLSFITDEILLELDCRISFAFGWPHVYIRCTLLPTINDRVNRQTECIFQFISCHFPTPPRPLYPSLSLSHHTPPSLRRHSSQNRSQCVFFRSRSLCIAPIL